MNDSLIYLWVAVAVVWLGTLAYVWTLIRRQVAVRKQLEQVRRMLNPYHAQEARGERGG
ncbi:MAG: CcmD family protein [Alicyclobacillus herbarius]|uniref:CcmD family protein n=1 Tax=Alicyclobacillus herbarius TaxID=122960 RepID=UPI0004258923|nr:CcmD family protein [Alicyclobacillus herbarius]MCL6631229.1 CcmD family protein [Alicyclobacillus herbarius]